MSRRFIIFSITLVAFLLNVIVPFYAVYDLDALKISSNLSSEEALLAEADGSILICTVDGFRLVSLKDLQNETTPLEEHPTFQCAMCYVSQHDETLGVADMQTYEKIIYPQQLEVIGWDIAHVHFSKNYFVYKRQTRAPPSFSIIS